MIQSDSKQITYDDNVIILITMIKPNKKIISEIHKIARDQLYIENTCDEYKLDNNKYINWSNHMQSLFNIKYDINTQMYTIFSKTTTNNRSDQITNYNDFRENEIYHRKIEIKYLTTELDNASTSFTLSVDDDGKFDQSILDEIIRYKSMISNHKKQIDVLDMVDAIQYEETICQTSVTVRIGEQSQFITHANDRIQNMYSFMPLHEATVNTHGSVDANITKNLMSTKLPKMDIKI